MRSLINWKVLLGLSIAITALLFSVILLDIKSNRDQAQALINELTRTTQVAQVNNEKLKHLLDSTTTEVEQLEVRIAKLQAQKNSTSKPISAPVTLNSNSGVPDVSQSYYMNCESVVELEIPQKYAKSKLKYSSENANITETTEVGRIVMVPLHRNVKIVVESGGATIGTFEFLIRNVPEPRLHVFQENQRIDLQKGAMGKTLSSIKLVLETEDPDFKRVAPKDARYVVKKWELNITRGSSVILRKVCNSASLDLNAERSLLKAGDIVHIQSGECERMTYRDTNTKIYVKDEDLTFPIY